MIKLREFERLSYDDISDADLQALERACAKLGQPVLKFSRTWLAAQHYAGFIQEGSVQLQVLPKIVDEEEGDLGLFTSLLVLAGRVPPVQVGPGDLEKVSGSFMELWIRSFALDLRTQLQRNPRRRYRRERVRPRFLRGKLLSQKLASGRHETTMRYPCEVHSFGLDHPLYRLLRFCNRLLLRQTKKGDTKRMLEHNDLMLAEASLRPFQVQEARRIRLTRLSSSYASLLQQCLLLLDHSTVDLRPGRISQVSLMFDMNRVFQESVYQALKRHARELSLEGEAITRVERELFLGRLFGEFKMNVDIMLGTSGGRSVLLDTKYKQLDREKRHEGLHQADFYQMFGYGRAGRADHDHIVLLYPETTGVRREFVGRGVRLKVRGLDLGSAWQPELRRLDSKALARQAVEAIAR